MCLGWFLGCCRGGDVEYKCSKFLVYHAFHNLFTTVYVGRTFVRKVFLCPLANFVYYHGAEPLELK